MVSITVCIEPVWHPSPQPPSRCLLDTQTSLAKPCCLITMRRITLPITATQSDFHDPVGAACIPLSRNYSPCMYRKPSSAAAAAQLLAVTLMNPRTHAHWRHNELHLMMCVMQRHRHVWNWFDVNVLYALITPYLLFLHCCYADVQIYSICVVDFRLH